MYLFIAPAIHHLIYIDTLMMPSVSSFEGELWENIFRKIFLKNIPGKCFLESNSRKIFSKNYCRKIFLEKYIISGKYFLKSNFPENIF